MKHHRKEKIEKEMHKVISTIISTEIKDPRVGMVTLSRVEISPDLQSAKVFFTVFASNAKAEQTLNILNNAKGFVRNRLADEVKLRFIPEIKFYFDRGMQNAAEVERIIKEAKPKNE